MGFATFAANPIKNSRNPIGTATRLSNFWETSDSNFTYKILAVLMFLWVGYNNSAVAAEEERTYFHSRRKPDREYPFELYVKYKPTR